MYNINEDNLNYAGNFVSASGTFIPGFGYTGARAVVPGDNVLKPERPASDTLGVGIGFEASVSVAVTEYIPLATWNKKGVSLNVDNYFLDPDFAYRGVLGNTVYYGVQGLHP